jgi:hypothetical protein
MGRSVANVRRDSEERLFFRWLRGTMFLVPATLAYDVYGYWFSRGKVGAETHYY